MTRADLSKEPTDVAAMFDGVAGRYDLMNAILAFGQDRGWREAMVDALQLDEPGMVLDIAAGTGTSTAAIVKRGHRAIASDFSLGMMREGKKRQPHIPFVGADATNLPFSDDSFDASVISFALRNVQEPKKALQEMRRIVRPGGTVVVCEFSTPTNAAFRHVYTNYLMGLLPKVAEKVSTNGPAYTYLAESITHWPDQEELREWLLEAGLRGVQYRNLSGGIVALHRGIVHS